MGLVSGETRGWRPVRYQQRCLPPSVTAGPFTVEQHVAGHLPWHVQPGCVAAALTRFRELAVSPDPA